MKRGSRASPAGAWMKAIGVEYLDGRKWMGGSFQDRETRLTAFQAPHLRHLALVGFTAFRLVLDYSQLFWEISISYYYPKSDA